MITYNKAKELSDKFYKKPFDEITAIADNLIPSIFESIELLIKEATKDGKYQTNFSFYPFISKFDDDTQELLYPCLQKKVCAELEKFGFTYKWILFSAGVLNISWF